MSVIVFGLLFFGILCLPSPQPPSSSPPVRYWLARRRSQLAAEPGTPGLPQRRRRRRSWLTKKQFFYLCLCPHNYLGGGEWRRIGRVGLRGAVPHQSPSTQLKYATTGMLFTPKAFQGSEKSTVDLFLKNFLKTFTNQIFITTVALELIMNFLLTSYEVRSRSPGQISCSLSVSVCLSVCLSVGDQGMCDFLPPGELVTFFLITFCQDGIFFISPVPVRVPVRYDGAPKAPLLARKAS